MTAYIEAHGANLLGVGFLGVLWVAAACLVAGLAIFWIPAAVNSAHLQLCELRQRRRKAFLGRMASADKVLGQR